MHTGSCNLLDSPSSMEPQAKKNLSIVGNRSFVAVGVALLVLLPASCKSGNHNQLAEQGVTEFHWHLDSEQYEAIVGESDEYLRTSNGGTFPSFLRAIHRKLGRVQEARLTGSQVGWFAGEGTVITLFYNTQFEGGAAGEKFVWHFKNNRPVLHGYFVSSNDLIMK